MVAGAGAVGLALCGYPEIIEQAGRVSMKQVLTPVEKINYSL